MSREQASADLCKWLIEDAEAMNDTSEQPVYEYRSAWRLTDGSVVAQDNYGGSLDYARGVAAGMLDFHRSQVVEAWIERRQVGPWEKVPLGENEDD